ncbi:MAG: hypothetical protein AAF985_12455 [Bacteroidota bacterium]
MQKIYQLNYLFLFFCWFPLVGIWAQENTSEQLDVRFVVGTRIGLNTLNEINLEGAYRLDLERSLVFALGYNYGSGILPAGAMFCHVKRYNELYNRKGINFRTGFRFLIKDKKKKKVYSLLKVLYRYSWLDDMEIYSSCFSGSGTGTYDRYDATAHELGLMQYFDFFRERRFINFYVGLGLSYIWQFEKTKAIPGNDFFPGTPAMDRTDHRLMAKFDLGIKVTLFGR